MRSQARNIKLKIDNTHNTRKLLSFKKKEKDINLVRKSAKIIKRQKKQREGGEGENRTRKEKEQYTSP